MALDSRDWGTFAAFTPPRTALVSWAQLAVSRADAEATLARGPDYEDATITSWGQLSLDEAERLAGLEDDMELRAETLALIRSLFDARPLPRLSLYYTDPHRGH